MATYYATRNVRHNQDKFAPGEKIANIDDAAGELLVKSGAATTDLKQAKALRPATAATTGGGNDAGATGATPPAGGEQAPAPDTGKADKGK